MSLRVRLALITLALALAFAGVLMLGYSQLSLRVADELVAALVRSEATRSRCEIGRATPRSLQVDRVGGGGTMWLEVELHAGTQLLSARAPQLLDALRAGESLAGRSTSEARELVVALAPAPGGCTHAWARGPSLRPRMPPPPLVLGPLVIALLAVTIGLAPVVARTRALTLAVRRWRADPGSAIPPGDPTRDEIGELSRAYHDAALRLREQHDELAARERGLREFVENVSHDLATPLSVLQGHLAALLVAPTPARVREAVQEAEYLGALLSSLGVSAKLDGALGLECVFELAPIVERVADRHRFVAGERGMSLEHCLPDDPVLVRGDPTFVEQAIGNLVGNAIRHGLSGGKVALLLDIEQTEFVVRVLDDGPGMPDADLIRVLRRGERGDRARGRERPGMGLGLSIVARVAQLHGFAFALRRGGERGLVAELRGAMASVEAV